MARLSHRLLPSLLLLLGACSVSTRTPNTARDLKQAPSFSLPDQQGRTVSLDSLIGSGRAVLVFYRGHW